MTTAILIVEDSRTQAEMYRVVLERAGYVPTVVATAERALAKLMFADFALVITDVGLPGMDGFTLCERIRSLPTHKDLPVLVQTADTDPANVLRGLEAGVTGFMIKNAGPAALVARVRSALSATDDGVAFMGRKFKVRSDRRAVVGTLVGAFEDLVRSRRMEAVLDTVPVGVVSIDRNGDRRIFNKAAEQLLAASDMPERIAEMINTCLQTKASEDQAEITVLGVPLVVAVRAVLDEASHVDEVVVTLTPVTELYKERERALESEMMALKASQAKSAFLATMSHELRTPLNAILGYAELLMEDATETSNQAAIEDLQKIHGAGAHLLRLINDILDLSKVEAGRMELNLEGFLVDGLVQEVCVAVEPLVRKNNNTFVVDVAPDVRAMVADVTKVRQCLINLIGNAAKFTSNGSVRLEVWREQVDDGEWLNFNVSDTGIGMTPDQLDRVFNEFTQADASTTRQYGGTGLGLTLTRRFASLLHGHVEVSSEFGVGSDFTLTIPANVAMFGRTAGAHLGASRAASGGEHLVLVIDDDDAVLEILRRTLIADGYTVLTARSGEEALDLARIHQPAAITLDVMMPNTDGWSTLGQLKADPTTADIPVIMCTMAGNQELGFSLGAAAFLNKPVDRPRLLATLARFRHDKRRPVALIVDDEASVRDLLRRSLEPLGWEVFEAADGRDGLEQLDLHKPDVVVLDLMMPVMDGFQFLQVSRENPVWASIPKVVVTAKTLTNAERELLEALATQTLCKHAVSVDDLLHELRVRLAEICAPPQPVKHAV